MRRIFAPPAFIDDNDKTFVASLLNTILFSILFGAILYGILAPVTINQLGLRLAYVGVIVLMVVSLHYLMHRGYVRFSSVAVVVGIWLVLTVGSFSGAGVRTPGFSGYIIVILIAGLLLGQWAALGTAVVCILTGAGMLYLIPPDTAVAPLESDVAFWVAQSVYFLVTAVFLTLTLRTLTNALQLAQQEIGKRTRIEEALRSSEEKFYKAFHASPVSMSIRELQTGRFLDVNAVFNELTGYNNDEVIGKTVREIYLWLDDKEYQALQQILHRAGSLRNFEAQIRKKSGEQRIVLVSTEIIYLNNLPCVLGTQLDITAQKQAENALRNAEERYRAFITLSTDGIYRSEFNPPVDISLPIDEQIRLMMANGRIAECNDALAVQYGLNRADEFIHLRLNPFDRSAISQSTEISRQFIHKGYRLSSVEFDTTNYIGQKRTFSLSSSGVLENGKLTRIWNVQRDVTTNKQAQESLKLNTERLKIVHDIDQAILAAHSVDTITQAAFNHLQRLLPWWGAQVALFEGDEAYLIASYLGKEGIPITERVERYELGLPDTLAQGRIQLVDDILELATLTSGEQKAVAEGLRSYLRLPLMIKGEMMGYMVLFSTEPKGFQDEVIEIIQDVGHQLSIAIQQARLYEQVQRQNEELEEKVTIRTRELAEANERLTELDRLRSKFVSDVSHELRTPVTNLQLHLDLLERGKPERKDHYIQVLRQQLGRLRYLVEGILNLSRLELARDRVAFGAVDLNRLVYEAVALHQVQAEAARVTLTFEPDAALPLVHGEVNQLGQVIGNLLANAMNYTAVGYVRVATFQTNQQGCLSVEDSGLGIDAEDLPHIFDRFYRGKGPMEQNIPGTGLGLGIVKEIVDLHRGQITVHSEAGKGSIFQVCLPLYEEKR